MSRKLILYISCSLDGFIAKPNDDLSFLSIVNQYGDDYGYTKFIDSVDTVIMGRKTYDWVMQRVDVFPHFDKQTYVLTKSKISPKRNIVFYNQNIKELVLKLKKEKGKKIFCDGGAQVVNELLKENLFDELIISIVPILLGDGLKLFQTGIPERILKLISSQSFKSGLIQLHYQFKN